MWEKKLETLMEIVLPVFVLALIASLLVVVPMAFYNDYLEVKCSNACYDSGGDKAALTQGNCWCWRGDEPARLIEP